MQTMTRVTHAPGAHAPTLLLLLLLLLLLRARAHKNTSGPP